MPKLKIILQSNKFYLLLFLLITIYIIITTIIIKYDTKIKNYDYLEGRIIDITYKEDKISFILKDKEKIMCTYYYEGNIPSNLLGKKVKVEGKIANLTNNTIPNTFNYKEYLYNQKIYLNYTVYNLEIINQKENIFYKLKNKIIDKINSYHSLEKTYLNLFILGDRTYLESDIYDMYRINGIWHLFAISGMHIGLIIMILNKLFKGHKIIIMGVLFYFLFLTGFSASVLRAVLFYLFKCLNTSFKLNLSNLKILFLTAFTILFINPFMLYNIGFLYSFLITFTLLLFNKKITGNYFSKIFKISFLATLVSLPLTINMNYEINILSIFLNIIFVPLISLFIFPLAILTFFIPPFHHILKIFLIVLEFLNKFFYELKLSIIIPKLPIIFIILYYIIILLIYYFNNQKLILCLFIILIINIILPKLDHNYYVYYLDVSQGDCSLIISPFKKNVIMIDTGGIVNSNYHISNNVILFLKSLGISKIDTLSLSHGDYDHLGDALNLVSNFKIKNVIFNCGEFNTLEEELIKKLDELKINYNSCVSQINFNNINLYYLKQNIYDNENDNSNINYLKINNYKFLFMGDASMEVEQNLITKYNLNNIDVLKVGHHGSKTSSSKSFLKNINPKYAIISVGRNNRYNHPNQEVLDNLENIKIYRTDLNGSIRFKINNKLTITNYPP